MCYSILYFTLSTEKNDSSVVLKSLNPEGPLGSYLCDVTLPSLYHVSVSSCGTKKINRIFLPGDKTSEFPFSPVCFLSSCFFCLFFLCFFFFCFCFCFFLFFLAHLSSAQDELFRSLFVCRPSVRPSVRASVRPCVRPLTFSNDFSSETAEPILLKFHMEPP